MVNIADSPCEGDRLSLDKQILLKQSAAAAALQVAEHALAAADTEAERKKAAKAVIQWKERSDRINAFAALRSVTYARKAKTVVRVEELRFSPGGLPEVAIAYPTGARVSTVPETLTPWLPERGERVFWETRQGQDAAQVVDPIPGSQDYLLWVCHRRAVHRAILSELHPSPEGFDLNLETGDRVCYQGQPGTVEESGCKVAICLDSGDTIQVDPTSLGLSWVHPIEQPEEKPKPTFKSPSVWIPEKGDRVVYQPSWSPNLQAGTVVQVAALDDGRYGVQIKADCLPKNESPDFSNSVINCGKLALALPQVGDVLHWNFDQPAKGTVVKVSQHSCTVEYDGGQTVRGQKPLDLAHCFCPIPETLPASNPSPEDEIAAAADRIRTRLKRTSEDIIEIGKDMLRVKELLGHGRFGAWLSDEFDMHETSAQKFMQVAREFGDKSGIIRDLKPTALYLLARPSTPEVVREEAIARAASGAPMKVREIEEAIAETVTPEVETVFEDRGSGRDFQSVKQEDRARAKDLGIPVRGLPDNGDREQHDALESVGENAPPPSFLPVQLKRAIWSVLTPDALARMGDRDRMQVGAVLEEARLILARKAPA